MTSPTKLIVGLGNPGSKYAHNRHNVGFMLLAEIARQHNFIKGAEKFNSHTATATLGTEKILALWPQTFMNDSGRAVQAAAAFYKITPANIIVLHDELDLTFAKVRMKLGGGDAGHNGLRSITAALGADYWRVRIGIGHPGSKEQVMGHALGDFTADETEVLNKLLPALAAPLTAIINGDINSVQNAAAAAIPSITKPELNQE